ncbi:hypothetical protein [Williamsia sp. CHRR-6]|uniref:hypothetical protein n=1 Tax=Williamsia sp. CHRR-6 TaxID=2835871 RepID=UPI001BDAB797|nr:hypothetical protein [Williamsia sp. CHRR-6]MBT0568291.1 hypothetical protein [Williamsia sp. CHRR-6]
MIVFARSEDRNDLYAFLSHALRVDDTALVRLRRRGDGSVGAWVQTPFDVLATRVVALQIEALDVVFDAATLQTELRPSTADLTVDPGYSLDSAWQGALPPERGFVHIDDVPARSVVELSRGGATLARTEAGPLGPPTELLDHTVLSVTGAGVDRPVEISLRSVFALTAMGFVVDAAGGAVTATSPLADIAADEPVRVRATTVWARLDARYGSVYQRRTAAIPLFT